MRISLLPLLLACQFDASTKVEAGDGPVADTGPDDTADSGDTDDTDDTGDTAEDPGPTDDDGDGVSIEDGDCDDEDSTIYPGATDACDGVDEDCDGEVDEDAVDEDPYEPNDTSPHALGSLHDDGAHTLQGTLHNDDDVDQFSFTLEDSSWSLFDLSVSLGSIPEDASYGLKVTNQTTGEERYDDDGSGTLEAVLDDQALHDDGGTYLVEVSANDGATCARRYLLTVTFSD